jgi:hypothetical protein
MENFEIEDYLENLDRLTGKGSCRTCAKPIHWSRESVRGHKRTGMLKYMYLDRDTCIFGILGI